MAPKGSSSQSRDPVPLLVELHAAVLSTWRDDDGYGNTDSDYWTMSLKVQSWPSKSEVLARIRSHDALDSNGLYLIKGRMYINPGKEWTDTYVRIDSAQKFQGPGTIRSDMQPTFEVIANIRAVQDKHLTLSWFAWDGYQNAGYNQVARANLTKRIPRSRTYVNLMARITGVMNGPDHKKDWSCTCIEPEVDAPPSPTEYLDSLTHGLSAIHTLGGMTLMHNNVHFGVDVAKKLVAANPS